MAEAQFRQALDRCGFNATTRDYLIEMGLDLPTLMDYTEDEFSQLSSGARYYNVPAGAGVPLILQPSALKKLKGFQLFIQYCELRNQIYDATSFTARQATKWSKRVTFLRREKDKDKTEVTPPDNLKSLSKFTVFEQQLNNMLTQTRGAAGTPMVYLTREHDEATQEMFDRDYSDIDEDLYDNIDFDHAFAKEDDEQFYIKLRELCAEGQAATYVDKYEARKEGRRAFMQIKSMCEGDAGKSQKIAQANQERRRSVYYGTSRSKTYSLETHIARLHEAYRTLEKYNQTVAQETQVQEFLDSIRDKRLSTNKLLILSNQELRTSFTNAAESMKTAALALGTTSDPNPRRDVLQVDSDARDGSGFPHEITARNYTNEEIRLFTPEQKLLLKKVRRKAREAREKQQRHKSKAKRAPKRQVSTVGTAGSDSDGDNEGDDEGEPSASDQFGRNARKGGKDRKKSKKQS